jgi:hypothetical protein
MDLLLSIQRVLWVACLVAQVLLIGAIFQRRIARRYRFFLAYLIVEAATGVVLFQIPYNTPAYAQAYRFYETAIVALRAGAVAELFELVCQHFPVIGRVRFALAISVVVPTALVSIAAVRPAGGSWQYPQTLAMYVQQFETTVLAVALILTWWFLTRFMSLSPTVRGNVALHWTLLTIYLGISGLYSLIATVGGPATVQFMNVPMLAADLLCYLAWIWGLQRVGEVPPPLILSPQEAAARRVLRQAILQHVKKARR